MDQAYELKICLTLQVTKALQGFVVVDNVCLNIVSPAHTHFLITHQITVNQ